jgi:transcriptional regulator with XRE-family HTH domain
VNVKRDKSLSHADITPMLLEIMNLKSQLKYFLDVKDMTATQLAKKAGVPKQSLSGWLAGSNPRDVRQIKRVADVLETTLDNLMFGAGENNDRQRVIELDALMGDGWISGLFEVRFRRIKK